jgi:hypothetical protein
MEGWSQEMIDTRVAWSAELWNSVKGQMTAYQLTVDKNAAYSQLSSQLKQLAQNYGTYQGMVHLDEYGQRYGVSLDSIKAYPRVMMYEMKRISPPGPDAQWVVKGDPQEQIHWFQRKNWMEDRRSDVSRKC